MFSLTLNVIGYNLLLRLADAEGPIPFLPLEPHSVLVKPSRAVALQLLNGFRNGDQKMDVVGRAPGGNECDLLRASHPGQISTKLDRIGYEVGALFRAEYAMHEHPGMSMGHKMRLSARVLWFSDVQHTTWFICRPLRGRELRQQSQSRQAGPRGCTRRVEME